MKYKVLFLIDYYIQDAGASDALTKLIEEDSNLEDYLVLASIVRETPARFKIKCIDSVGEISDILNTNYFDFIHYFKSSSLFIFDRTIAALKKCRLSIPIITTLCQQPNIRDLYLSPREIKYSDIIVFIDQYAYNHQLISFIDQQKKRLSYIGITEKVINQTKELIINNSHKNKDYIVFGRGSTANKCHKEFINVFNEIKIDNKLFEIVGIKDTSKFKNNQKNIKFIPPLSFEDWLNKCNGFDIFLYVLPENAHSSIDGTLGHAMLLQKPVVYYGPEAPKERIQNGINGYIANSLSEIAPICEFLIDNPSKAKQIGEAARKTTMSDFNFKTTLENYHKFYNDLIEHTPVKNSNNIPLKYRILYYSNNLRYLIKKAYRAIIKPH